MADVDPPTLLVSGCVGLQDPVALGATGSCLIPARYDAFPQTPISEIACPDAPAPCRRSCPRWS